MSLNRNTRLFPRLVSLGLLRLLLLSFLLLSFLLLTLFSQLVLAQPARQPVEGNPVRTPFSTEVQPQWLSQMLPGAESFSEKEGEPPVYRGYRQNPDNGQQELVGYVFLSADVPPEERGYSAPLDMLIGLNTDNQVSGFKLLDYVESYVNTVGDFAADPVFQAQLQNKHVADEFRLLRDIDGIAGATVTSFAITRGVREAARRVAEAYNNFIPGNPVDRARSERVLEEMRQYSWQDLIDQGVVKQLVMPVPGGSQLELTFTYLGHAALGEFFIGRTAYARAERDASSRLGGAQMMLLAVGGEGFGQFCPQTFEGVPLAPRLAAPLGFDGVGSGHGSPTASDEGCSIFNFAPSAGRPGPCHPRRSEAEIGDGIRTSHLHTPGQPAWAEPGDGWRPLRSLA
jgi:hypothetical protein